MRDIFRSGEPEALPRGPKGGADRERNRASPASRTSPGPRPAPLRPVNRDPPGAGQRPASSSGATEGREPVSAPSLSPRPARPAGRSCPACGERPAASLARGLGVPARWVAYLSYLHPRRPTSSRCPRPRSCSPRFRRSPPPSHRDGSSPSYPLGNGLAFSSRAVASHSRRPARPPPLQ